MTQKPKQPLASNGVYLALAGIAVLLLLALGRAFLGSVPPSEELPPAERGASDVELSEEFLTRIRRTEVYEHDGKYLLGPEFLDVFNGFRAEYAEQGKAAMIAAFARWAQDNYSEEVAVFLLDVFKKYIAYLERLSDSSMFPADATLDQKYQMILALRIRIFGEEIARLLFRHEDERIQFALALQAIRNDPALSEEEKRQKAEALKDGLDPDERARLFPPNPYLDYRDKLEQLKRETDELPPEEQAGRVRALRVEMFGEEAADRLEKLDEVRAERGVREQVYEEEKAEIAADESLSPEEKKRQIELLRQDVLRPEQVRRARALEALEQLTPEAVAERIRAVQEGEAPAPDWDSPEQQGANIQAEGE